MTLSCAPTHYRKVVLTSSNANFSNFEEALSGFLRYAQKEKEEPHATIRSSAKVNLQRASRSLDDSEMDH
jgi:hypothetical protein